ncbi:MAG: hypothetical protein ACR2GN_08235, partial [Bacteroidia bacterium]
MKGFQTHLLVILLAVVLLSCRKNEEFPLEPHIDFKDITHNKNIQGKDTSITLIFSFTDGDGDVGFQKNESGPPFTGEYEYNFYVNYQEKNASGQFVPVIVPTYVDSITPDGDIIVIIKYLPIQFTYRLPYMANSGRNKAIKGDIAVEINTFGFSPVSRLEFFMYDRALNKSN